MPRSAKGGLLDLGELAPAPTKVRIPVPPWPRGLRWLRRLCWWLPTVRLYDMADPSSLGALSMQRLASRQRRAEAIADADEPSDEELAEMADLLVDICQMIVPDAPRSALTALGIRQQERLTEAFFRASPAANRRQRRAEAKTEKTSTSGSS